MADTAPAPVQQPLSPVKEIPVFEFTKRKRWADLLVTELNDTVIFVLSETCQVWYCGSAVTELLGWRDDELVDGDLLDLMNGASRSRLVEGISCSGVTCLGVQRTIGAISVLRSPTVCARRRRCSRMRDCSARTSSMCPETTRLRRRRSSLRFGEDHTICRTQTTSSATSPWRSRTPVGIQPCTSTPTLSLP